MGIILGIDVGGSTTKIVAFRTKKEMIGCLQVKATDQLTSLYGAIGHFMNKYKLSLNDISKIALTGVGASFITDDIYGIPTFKVDEFQAIGLGGSMLSKLDQALVVSMGTGSAYVRVIKDQVTHIGGSGIGGGSLLGISSKLINENDIATISSIAEKGDLTKVDLTIQDISKEIIPKLPPATTASNFGHIKSDATKEDIALGVINMVFQTIGMLAVFACLDSPIRDVVLTGALTSLPQTKSVFEEVSKLYSINFIVPPYAVFSTAIGATVPYLTE
ncbi:MAG: pantothenate kinase, acetyl-CoA regulated [Bacillota bacterium]|jgi:type II pantothenate kinase|nr:pantothenate kinase, acetyl-CoA regulated [Bacillota bacterium]